jgi:uncharacterized protein YqeY
VSISEDVQTQITTALKQGDKLRLNTLRSMKSAFLNEMKKDGADTIADDICIRILRKLAKQRIESMEAFEKGDRAEQAAAERSELEIIEAFLPNLADEQTVRAWVEEAIAASGAQAPGDVGRVMGALMKAHKGEMDAGVAKTIASEILSG